MQDTIILVGRVGTRPRHIVTANGTPITSFRLVSTHRRFDKGSSRFVDGESNWYSVSAFRQLAVNVAASIETGDLVIVTGRLKVQNWENGGRSGLNVEVEADAIGHDLTWGTTRYVKTYTSRSGAQDAGAAGAEEQDPDDSFADVAEPDDARDPVPDGAAVVTPF